MLSEEEKEAIEMLKRIDVKFFLNGSIEQSNFIIGEADKVNNSIEIVLNLIQKQQAELEKKDKIIDKMAEKLVKDTEWFYSEFDNYTKEDFIEYFTKLAEEDKQ